MEPVLIYDIESENMSQTSEDHPKSLPLSPQGLKETEVTEKAHTQLVQVRSQQSQHSQASEKRMKLRQMESSMIFMQQSLGRGDLLAFSARTSRRLLKEEQPGVFQWQSQGARKQQEYEGGCHNEQFSQEGQQPKQEGESQGQQQSLESQKEQQQKARRGGTAEQKGGLQRIGNHLVLTANADLFVRQIIPKHYKLTCYLSIEHNAIGLQSYRLYLDQQRHFLLAAKKQFLKYYSNYLISRHPAQIHRRTDQYIGHIHANFVGTDFELYAVKGEVERLSLSVEYRKNIVGFNGPRSFTVTKGHPSNTKHCNLRTPIEPKEKLIRLQTVQPSITKGKYRLDFGGKAKIASSKNFILAREENKEWRNCLVFGKVKQSQFWMQIGYPLSVFEAFGICLSSLDSKILVN